MLRTKTSFLTLDFIKKCVKMCISKKGNMNNIDYKRINKHININKDNIDYLFNNVYDENDPVIEQGLKNKEYVDFESWLVFTVETGGIEEIEYLLDENNAII